MREKRLMLGNEAIARGLIENGCRVATSYPGTPASEILTAIARFQEEEHLAMHTQWAVNEKVAFEIAYAAAMTGVRAAVSMKQVGLNVASDPLMSAAYLGTKGGFIVISADDPGPHSSQTEQDSRLMAMMAKIAVLDPDSPARAKQMTTLAFRLSEAFEIPVMLRPTTRVCHARQDILPLTVQSATAVANFEKNPSRWAATPKFRLRLHRQLVGKLAALASFKESEPRLLSGPPQSGLAVVASGVAAAHVREMFDDLKWADRAALYQVFQPYPLHQTLIRDVTSQHAEVLVIEETMPVIEMQLADRHHVRGRLTRHVPNAGELLPETIEQILAEFVGQPAPVYSIPTASGRRPTLCAGCPHRASFYAIKRAAPKAIYTSDIGCYTLGLNLGAVDTVLCMGAAVSQAAGFYQAHRYDPNPPDIVATIGDSTFFHSGLPPLIDAVSQRVPMVLVILDNRTTAMTGSQPTPASGLGACGECLDSVDIETLVNGCGVRYCRVGDPYELKGFIALVKEALRHCRTQGPAVVIARHACLLDPSAGSVTTAATEILVSDHCDGCGYCIDQFECPALSIDEATGRAGIDSFLCSRCGVCIQVCPKKSIEATDGDGPAGKTQRD